METRTVDGAAGRRTRGSGTTSRGIAARWTVRGAGLAAGAVFSVAVAFALAAAWRVGLLLFVAILIGAALDPLTVRLRGKAGIPRGAAILVVFGVFFTVVVLFSLLVLPGAIQQMGQLAQTLPTALSDLRREVASLQPPALAASLTAIIDAATQALRPGQPPPTGDIVAAGLTVADLAFSVLTVLTLVYFWLTERPRLQRFVLSLLPARRRAGVRRTWNAIELRMGGWLRGQLILMGLLAVMTTIVYTILGLPSALVLGIFAGLAEVIPVVGPLIGAVPAVLTAAVLRPDVLVFVVIAYVAIQVVEGNVLVPMVMRNAVGISPFLTVISILAAGAVGGLPGALIAVPLAAALVVVLERAQDRRVPVAQESASALTPPPATDESVPRGGSAEADTDSAAAAPPRRRLRGDRLILSDVPPRSKA